MIRIAEEAISFYRHRAIAERYGDLTQRDGQISAAWRGQLHRLRGRVITSSVKISSHNTTGQSGI